MSMSLIYKIKEKIKRRKQERINTYKPIFNNLKIENEGLYTKIFIDGVEQQKVLKIVLYQVAGDLPEFYIEKDK